MARHPNTQTDEFSVPIKVRVNELWNTSYCDDIETAVFWGLFHIGKKTSYQFRRSQQISGVTRHTFPPLLRVGASCQLFSDTIFEYLSLSKSCNPNYLVNLPYLHFFLTVSDFSNPVRNSFAYLCKMILIFMRSYILYSKIVKPFLFLHIY